MSKKLLHKTTRSLLALSIVILLVAAPVFYYLTNWLYITEVNETLTLQKEEFLEYRLPNFRQNEIEVWNRYNRNVKILPSRNLKQDSLYTTVYFDALEDENEPYRELIAPVEIGGKPYTFQARINLIEQEDLVLGVAVLFLAVIVLLLGGILLMNKIVSKRIWKPFYKTLDGIETFELDKNERPVFPETDIDEFSRLNKSFNRLIEKNTAIYKAQREFVENAAHELQTPLALFQGKIDMLYQTALDKEQSHMVEALNIDVGRLNRLNKNLLLLSKIDNESFVEKQDFAFGDYLEKNKEFFVEQAKPKQLQLQMNLEQVSVSSNATLAEVAVNNLLLNAIRHNVKNGQIAVSLTSDKLVVANSGNESLNSQRLFNRFYKHDSSSKGNGLGLAIIKRITEINGWQIAYDFSNGRHIFTLSFS